MSNTIKRSLVGLGRKLIHRRSMFGYTTAGERGYFTRYTTGKAKAEVHG